MKHKALILVGLLSLAAPTLAGELDKRHVSAKARWVAHFDMSIFKQTALYREIEKHDGFDDMDLDEIQRELGINPFTDFKSATIYGVGDDPEDAVVVAVGTSKVDGLLERMKQESAYRSVELGGLRMHAWHEGHSNDANGYSYVHYPKNGDERIVVLAETKERVLHGAEVLLGERENLLQTSDPRVMATPRAGSFLFVAVEDLSGLSKFDPTSQVAELARGVVIDIGENRETLYARVDVETKTIEDANNVASVVNGAKALLSMVGGQDVPQQVRDLVNAVQIRTQGTRVLVEIEYEVARLIRELQQLDQDY